MTTPTQRRPHTSCWERITALEAKLAKAEQEAARLREALRGIANYPRPTMQWDEWRNAAIAEANIAGEALATAQPASKEQ